MTQKYLIVGHKGRMGAYFYKTATKAGLNVRGVDQPLNPKKLAKACHKADIVMLCVPAMVMHEVITACVPHMEPHAILTDITSVKVQPMQSMAELWHGPLVGTHPLFGPKPPQAEHLPVAITPHERTAEAHTQCIEALFTRMGCSPFRTTPAQHDTAMAAIQGLNFITNLAYFATLAKHEELLPFLTPSFMRRQQAAQKLLTEDAALFEGLFEANPFSHDAVRQYRAFLNLAAAGEISLLSQLAAWWWQK